MKKHIIYNLIIISIFLIGGFTLFLRPDYTAIMAVTGATPLATEQDVPGNASFIINGLVKREYKFNAKALDAFAKTRIRTKEISPEGKFLGTYIYNGIPLFNILEGIAPERAKDAVFDRPLDMIVEITSHAGKKIRFSYSELTMTDDALPVILAFHRSELIPHKDPKIYNKNLYKEDLTGLKIISPREFNTARYLDDVKSITLSVLKTPASILPPLSKGKKCASSGVQCVKNGKAFNSIYKGVKRNRIKNWTRIGHSRGYKGVSTGEGYSLISFLKKNFPGCSDRDYFMFIACDGYRSLYSGKEIFSTKAGESIHLLIEMNGKKPRGNYMLASVDDYFVDRDLWGLTHIVIIKESKVK